jgi:hypothetical protein
MTQMEAQPPEELFRAFNCEYRVLGSQREKLSRKKKQDRVSKTWEHFKEVRPYATTQEQALALVKDKWTYEMGPIAAWLAWTVVSSLVKSIVFWLWERYSS